MEYFFFQAEDGIRDLYVTGVQTCALPILERQDFVANMNDSYWLTNPAQPLTGFARIIGNENAERTLRTRLEIGRASCRERVKLMVGAVTLKTKLDRTKKL